MLENKVKREREWRFLFFPLPPPLFLVSTWLPQTDVTNGQSGEGGGAYHSNPKNSCVGKVSKNQLTLLPMFHLEHNIIKEQQGYLGVHFRVERERES